MLNRCSKCSKVIPASDEMVYKGKPYHKKCERYVEAQDLYPDGFALWIKINSCIEYLDEIDPMDLFASAKLQDIYESFGFDPPAKEINIFPGALIDLEIG